MISNRIKEARLKLGLNQSDFACRIGIKQAGISALEKGIRNVTDRTILLICREFNVNEEWLRTGNGDMFIEPDEFSLDNYIKEKGATDFEVELIKSFFEIPEEHRTKFLNNLKSYVLSNFKDNEITATTDNNVIKLENNNKDDKEVFVPYKSLDELGGCNAAHDDDLTEEEKILYDKISLDAINKRELEKFNERKKKNK